MNLLLKEILSIQNWENQYNCYARKNLLRSLNFKLINEQNFENFQNFIQAIVEQGPRKSKKRWVSNERRILHILLNCMSVIKKQTIHEFKTSDILRIHRVFRYKDKHSIQYQIRKLSTNNNQNRRRWSRKQENFLEDIVKKTQNKTKWNEIARQLFINSKGQYFRQGKHCRQRFCKLKDGKSQFSESELIPNNQQSEKKKSMQFHGHDRSALRQKIPMEADILQNMESPNVQKNNHKNQVDYISKKYKSSIRTEILASSNSKVIKPSRNKSEKQRSTLQNISGGYSYQESLNNNLKVGQKMKMENNGSIGLNFSLIKPIEEKQHLEAQKVENFQHPTSEIALPGMGLNGLSVGFPTMQMPNSNGLTDQGWNNLLGYWPLGGFSFNFQGFY